MDSWTLQLCWLLQDVICEVAVSTRQRDRAAVRAAMFFSAPSNSVSAEAWLVTRHNRFCIGAAGPRPTRIDLFLVLCSHQTPTNRRQRPACWPGQSPGSAPQDPSQRLQLPLPPLRSAPHRHRPAFARPIANGVGLEQVFIKS